MGNTGQIPVEQCLVYGDIQGPAVFKFFGFCPFTAEGFRMWGGLNNSVIFEHTGDLTVDVLPFPKALE